MAKFRVYQDADCVMGHLRYGHREGIIDADSKEDALDKLKNEGYTDDLKFILDAFEVEDAYYDNNEFEIEEIVEETTEKNNGWIPVSKDNIPDHEVLACNEDGCELIGYIDIVGYGFFCEEGESGICMYDVVAWMEKPEPYKPEVQE